ncbi:hypothetical protein H257_16607 [Aphanomyces astaci]|uniref:Uncharacterized protein n=1 Tax=Aphanomyces astaci TaxID=112090 RepID=W4FJL9_APHAT|nr:hypothetical protein H257_16607 [Aphanomyces astaci]ETV67029.1 hypothetical protein H257_16607 [Aphanomyces astaci]|eukprot:XP_009843398.1 hypothetical protein H257_16607 [Aphanomyces astaci]
MPGKTKSTSSISFWKALVEYRSPDVNSSTVVALSEGTSLLGNPSLGSCVLLRHCYLHLFDLDIHDMTTPHVVIVGSLGIGKTFFGYLVLLRLAKAGKTVVYENGVTNTRILFSRDDDAKPAADDIESTSYHTMTIEQSSPQKHFLLNGICVHHPISGGGLLISLGWPATRCAAVANHQAKLEQALEVVTLDYTKRAISEIKWNGDEYRSDYFIAVWSLRRLRLRIEIRARSVPTPVRQGQKGTLLDFISNPPIERMAVSA